MLCRLGCALAPPTRCSGGAQHRSFQLGRNHGFSAGSSQADSVNRRLTSQAGNIRPIHYKPRQADAVGQFSYRALHACAADYGDMTLTYLKELLRTRGLRVSGLKSELVQRLQEADSKANACAADYKRMRVPERRALLEMRGLPSTKLKKEQLLERLQEADSLEKEAQLQGPEFSEDPSADAAVDRSVETQEPVQPVVETAYPISESKPTLFRIDHVRRSDRSADTKLPLKSTPNAQGIDVDDLQNRLEDIQFPRPDEPDSCNVSRTVGSFRHTVQLDGITVVTDEKSADRALRELERLKHRPHAWDTETAEISVRSQSPVNHGRAVCATCYCGDDADFGNGPRLLVDNWGPSAGLLELKFKAYFEDASYRKIFHNYSFDRHVLARHNILVQGLHADTLHLARLYDTSLASWEGRGQAQASTDEKAASGALQQAFSQASVSSAESAPVASKAVLAVRLGGAQLEKQVWSATAGLHTTALPADEALASGLGAVHSPKTMGYDLKYLSTHYKLVEDRLPAFSELFGVRADAAVKTHDSPEHFGQWAQYATSDAMLTYQLFEKLKLALDKRPWYTAVHEKPISTLLGDTAVAEELRMLQLNISKGKWKLLRGTAVETYGSVQTATGQNMWNFFEQYLRDFAECLADLEKIGIAVDLDVLREVQTLLEQDIEKERLTFAESFASMQGPQGELLNPDAVKINIQSSQQIGTLIFGGSSNLADGSRSEARRKFAAPKEGVDQAGAPRPTIFEIQSIGLQPPSRKKDYTKLGRPKVSRDVLQRIAADLVGEKHTHGLSASEARKASEGLLSLSAAAQAKRLLVGYAVPLQALASKTGRIHPSWKFDTSTGRLACRVPNIQSLPSSDKDKYGIRRAFRADPGNMFVIADYSQLELRVLAHVAKCPAMIKYLTEGGDFHSEVAAELYPYIREAISKGEVATAAGGSVASVKAVFPKERSSAKAINFGIIYGMTPGSLAEELNIEVDQAKQLMDTWLDSKPSVKKWLSAVKDESQKTQRSLSLLGRWRNFPFLDERASNYYRWKSMRAAVNFAIQGSAADIMLVAMLRLWKHAELEKLGYRMVMQAHDELVLEGPEENAPAVKRIVREVMMNPFKEKNPDFKFRVPLEVDISVRQRLAA
eukprot:TRINITY_DN2112_c0_g1_i9.p1 TRINITY_DN2112_c0_g1~~TRINITY_DN2112_c0_g1_i9.p1  ORF type:complete len:1129 (+),score=174.43 TRINITY_DN2112_c0_g1_i9:103-3489(+)